MQRFPYRGFHLLVLGALALGACDCDPGSGDDPGRDLGPGVDMLVTADLGPEVDGAIDMNAPECTTDADCGGGVCNAGACCASEEAACGPVCCEGAEVCVFDACVVPGDECVSEADCAEGEYCEASLGEETTDPGPGCTTPIQAGRCLPVPPECTGAADDPPDCLDACEYRPPAGMLDAVTEWQWGYAPAATEFPTKGDVWSTPTVGRLFDTNCDGTVDIADPPNVVFISGDSRTSQCAAGSVQTCKSGVLRVLDGASGAEVFSLDEAEATSEGFAATAPALGDVDADGSMDVVALTGEGKVALIDNTGVVFALSTEVVDGNGASNFGWGGGVALGDMNNDGWPEIAYGRSVFTMSGGTLALRFTGTASRGGISGGTGLSYFVDLDGDGDQELLAGDTAYDYDGAIVWENAPLNDGFTAVADLNDDDLPEVVLVRSGSLWVLEGASGTILLGPHDIPGNGNGGPPTIADFNGDGEPEIGVAMQNFYTMMKPNFAMARIDDLWSTPNHDNSSSVTGSSVFDFQGDGNAEVVYADECFLWVYDGTTGDIVYTTNTQSFTGTEAAIVADVDGDGQAEIVVVHNAANPTSWTCAEHTTGTDGYPIWSVPPEGAYKGITVLGDRASSWVGTRTLWNQHAYSVTNICDPRDSACSAGSHYGQIPAMPLENWEQPWLNNFRQNVQDGGLFDAPDPVVRLEATCETPSRLTVEVRNIGRRRLPAGVEVGLYTLDPETMIGTVTTTRPLLPAQTETLTFSGGSSTDTFQARILNDPAAPLFNECRPENNDSEPVEPDCLL
ncbi:MAG: VCBS repeat-containing protein [Deltaproteobacteria bacterium]|nr:VCBS repeat-containing protein [Deltaproteobacteria bacterium]